MFPFYLPKAVSILRLLSTRFRRQSIRSYIYRFQPDLRTATSILYNHASRLSFSLSSFITPSHSDRSDRHHISLSQFFSAHLYQQKTLHCPVICTQVPTEAAEDPSLNAPHYLHQHLHEFTDSYSHHSFSFPATFQLTVHSIPNLSSLPPVISLQTGNKSPAVNCLVLTIFINRTPYTAVSSSNDSHFDAKPRTSVNHPQKSLRYLYEFINSSLDRSSSFTAIFHISRRTLVTHYSLPFSAIILSTNLPR